MKNNSNLRLIKNKILHENFLFFVEKCFYSLNPNQKFFHSWHIELIACLLSQIEKGNIKRTIINIPPRSLKSITVSVAWVSWILGHDPTKRIICASYSQHISNKLSIDCKKIITAGWYQEIFPDTKILKGENMKNKFVTLKNGFRFSTSIYGSLTGEGGDILILDDPQNPRNIFSKKYQQYVINWYKNSFATRLNNRAEGIIIVIMQRISNYDLCAYLLKKNKHLWYHLSIPFFAQKDYSYEIGDDKFIFKQNTTLFPDSMVNYHQLIQDLGHTIFNAQYQQSPIISDGGFIKLKWFQRYEFNPIDMINKAAQIIQSWDTASKIGELNDYSTCTTWAIMDNKHYLLDVFRKKLEYPFLKKQLYELHLTWKSSIILIEDKASGQNLIQEIRLDQKFKSLPIVAMQVERDKVTRMLSALVLIENAQVYLPKDISWLRVYEEELIVFPNSKHDDQVDSTSQYCNWFKKQLFNNNRKSLTRIRRI